MRRRILAVALLLFVAGPVGCYHARIETGVLASATRIDQNWAPGFLFGLVPPGAVDTSGTCINGVSTVETQLGFANQLVSMLTVGIYTPMQINVTCAQ